MNRKTENNGIKFGEVVTSPYLCPAKMRKNRMWPEFHEGITQN